MGCKLAIILAIIAFARAHDTNQHGFQQRIPPVFQPAPPPVVHHLPPPPVVRAVGGNSQFNRIPLPIPMQHRTFSPPPVPAFDSPPNPPASIFAQGAAGSAPAVRHDGSGTNGNGAAVRPAPPVAANPGAPALRNGHTTTLNFTLTLHHRPANHALAPVPLPATLPPLPSILPPLPTDNAPPLILGPTPQIAPPVPTNGQQTIFRSGQSNGATHGSSGTNGNGAPTNGNGMPTNGNGMPTNGGVNGFANGGGRLPPVPTNGQQTIFRSGQSNGATHGSSGTNGNGAPTNGNGMPTNGNGFANGGGGLPPALSVQRGQPMFQPFPNAARAPVFTPEPVPIFTPRQVQVGGVRHTGSGTRGTAPNPGQIFNPLPIRTVGQAAPQPPAFVTVVAQPVLPPAVTEVWSDWGPWTQCSHSCGVRGEQRRHRFCTSGACPGFDYNRRRCSPTCCPVNGGWGQWSGWMRTAGNQHVRHRNCNFPSPSCLGTPCVGMRVQMAQSLPILRPMQRSLPRQVISNSGTMRG